MVRAVPPAAIVVPIMAATARSGRRFSRLWLPMRSRHRSSWRCGPTGSATWPHIRLICAAGGAGAASADGDGRHAASRRDRGAGAAGGLLVEPGLVDLLVREVEGEPGALPLLSHALLRGELWATPTCAGSLPFRTLRAVDGYAAVTEAGPDDSIATTVIDTTWQSPPTSYPVTPATIWHLARRDTVRTSRGQRRPATRRHPNGNGGRAAPGQGARHRRPSHTSTRTTLRPTSRICCTKRVARAE